VSTANDGPAQPSTDKPRPSAPPATDAAGAMRRLVAGMGFEVMPFKSTEESVARLVPLDVPLTVTTTAAKGLGTTLDLAERLSARGYRVAPHLAARQVKDGEEVAEIVDRLRAADIDRVFVIGGDIPHPAGIYRDALGLLRALEANGHSLTSIGIGGYPEGHGTIPSEAVDRALRDKAPHATHLVTQMCFHAETTTAWGESIGHDGVTLPVYVGMPGPVHRQKLIRISAGLGLGQSARFLQKQHGIWRFLVPGAYDPTKLVRRLAREASRSRANIAGLHIFTFNELEDAAAWRRRLRADVGLD
jgi:methylenetetrahydrofolate reductase (NADPH)